MVRRVLLLALVSVSGIALLAPLAARSAAELPTPAPDLLLSSTTRVVSDVLRGGTLSGRTTAAVPQPRQDAEALVRPRDAQTALALAPPRGQQAFEPLPAWPGAGAKPVPVRPGHKHR